VDGKLTFENLASGNDTGKGQYSVRWTSWDRDGHAIALPAAAGFAVPAFAGDTHYLAATIRPAEVGNDDPVTVYLRQGRTGPEVVGIER
jgi:hypothetical protein